MDPKLEEKASKYMCFVLRHSPESAHLNLSEEGFCYCRDLLLALKMAGYEMTFEDLCVLVRNDPKKRYSMDWSNQYIRCNQGHSTPMVNLKFERVIPPGYLYHGTSERFKESIAVEGLLPQTRHYIHLSERIDTAIEVGARHNRNGKDRIVVFKMEALAMHHLGYEFFLSENNVWLITHVPALWLTVEMTV